MNVSGFEAKEPQNGEVFLHGERTVGVGTLCNSENQSLIPSFGAYTGVLFCTFT